MAVLIFPVLFTVFFMFFFFFFGSTTDVGQGLPIPTCGLGFQWLIDSSHPSLFLTRLSNGWQITVPWTCKFYSIPNGIGPRERVGFGWVGWHRNQTPSFILYLMPLGFSARPKRAHVVKWHGWWWWWWWNALAARFADSSRKQVIIGRIYARTRLPCGNRAVVEKGRSWWWWRWFAAWWLIALSAAAVLVCRKGIGHPVDAGPRGPAIWQRISRWQVEAAAKHVGAGVWWAEWLLVSYRALQRIFPNERQNCV